MKRITYLTGSLIVACMVASNNPISKKQVGKRILINGTADLFERKE